MRKEIWFDMDGTIVDLYGVDGWFADLRSENARPYEIATPLINLSALARLLHHAQRNGYQIGVISWLARGASAEYDEMVRAAKIAWLARHMPSVEWDRVEIVQYGEYKERVCGYTDGILFDDEENNRRHWCGAAYDQNEILNVLRAL